MSISQAIGTIQHPAAPSQHPSRTQPEQGTAMSQQNTVNDDKAEIIEVLNLYAFALDLMTRFCGRTRIRRRLEAGAITRPSPTTRS